MSGIEMGGLVFSDVLGTGGFLSPGNSGRCPDVEADSRRGVGGRSSRRSHGSDLLLTMGDLHRECPREPWVPEIFQRR